jgi:hypothetical protein
MKERNVNVSNNSSVQESNNSMDANESQSFTSPYNSNNFMSPPIGGTVKCTTCHGGTIQGKVMAYDQQTKMLALSKASKSSKSLNDVSIINVAWCSHLEVIEEPTEAPETLLNLNMQKVNILNASFCIQFYF